MKNLIAAALVLLCILSMVGCDNRSMDKDLNEEAGTITFYSEPIKEAQNSVKPITGQIRVELDEGQANRISAIIDNVDEWVDDHTVNRLAYYFDGELEFADSEFAYYFTYEYNVIYYDHYFAEITDEEMQTIKGFEPTEQISSITQSEVEAMPEIFSTPDELVSAITGTEMQAADENAVDKVNISNIAYFYVPAESFPNFELLQLEVLAGRIIYYYVPTGTADQGFHYDTGIVVTYAREDDLTAKNPLMALAEQVNIDLTEEGFLYESERNSITFAVGNSWMSIRVPDSMNEYEQLKDFCTATKITVANEELQEIFDTPVDLVEFSNIDDFSAYLLSAEKNEDMADLASLTHYFLPTGIPEGYKLYKITAGVSDIGFWYLPDEFLSSTDATLDAEALQKHFLFISTRGTYEFGSLLAQFEATQDDLIDGRYLLQDGSEKIVVWEQNGSTLMMYLPASYDVDVASIHIICETEQYTKNAVTGVFECVQE